MAAFTKAAKWRQRPHLERGQLASRKALGPLEKKADYRLRAADFHKKRDALRALRRRAQEKNPDEFYFRMIRAPLQDGVHVISQQEAESTPEQQKLLKTQDLKYVEMKRAAEVKKIEQLKSELHLLEAEGKQPNKHLFFFDTKKEAGVAERQQRVKGAAAPHGSGTIEWEVHSQSGCCRKTLPWFPEDCSRQLARLASYLSVVQGFDVALHLNTAPELVSRVYNRPTLETLKKNAVSGITTDGQLQRLARQRKGRYSLLRERIERERKMFVITQKLQTRKDLLDKTERVKLKKETVNQPAIYKFQFRRKR